MGAGNPTFNEMWYRVAELRAQLRGSVRLRRQYFRGQLWYVLHDPMSNQFTRLHEAAYRFVAMLNGRRTVREVWETCLRQLGDDSLTQGEVIQLLMQLHERDLLQSDLAPDADSLFERKQNTDRQKAIGFAANPLFIRIPLLDPDAMLNRWVWAVGNLFTSWAMAIWAAIILVGVCIVVAKGNLLAETSAALAPGKLWLLYVSFVMLKAVHEFSHAFACKKLARDAGEDGEVHVMGVMFLVFFPKPYVDVSAAWALRSKWSRIAVNSAGIVAELVLASLAAVVWACTADGTTAHAIAYNLIFVAGTHTILFNGNPLLRYDGYYILSDLLEIPNLSMRSAQYVRYLVKRYAWGVTNVVSPADTPGEAVWMVLYGLASTCYRTVICIVIIWLVAAKAFIIGVLAAVAATVAWIATPAARFILYLAGNAELARVRRRAVATTLLTGAAMLWVLAVMPTTQKYRITGVTEPLRTADVYAASDGFVIEVMESGRLVAAGGRPLVRAENPELTAQMAELTARRRRLAAIRDQHINDEQLGEARIVDEKLKVVDGQISHLNGRIADLSVSAPLAGRWLAPRIHETIGSFVRKGDKLGTVADLDTLIIRATASQDLAPMLLAKKNLPVEICLQGRPGMTFAGKTTDAPPVGVRRLPAASLAHQAGGATIADLDEAGRADARDRFFEIRIELDTDHDGRDKNPRLFAGQRVLVRLELEPKPLAAQYLRKLRALFQNRRRF